jgi:hypothetical protein
MNGEFFFGKLVSSWSLGPKMGFKEILVVGAAN